MYIQRNDNGRSFVLNRSNDHLILGANNLTDQLYLKGDVGIGTETPIINYMLMVMLKPTNY